MRGYRLAIGLSALALGLGSCSFVEDSLLPSLTGEPPPASDEVPVAASEAEGAAPVQKVETAEMARPGAAAPAATGTAVGETVASLRGALEALQASLAERQQSYDHLHGTIQQTLESYLATEAAIAARLKIGTTPANPVLLGQWDSAEADLDRLAANLDAMETLGDQMAADSTTANSLIGEARAAYAMPGGIEEDHRQLREIEGEASQSITTIDRLMTDTRQTVDRYRGLLIPERDNLQALQVAIEAGEYFYQSPGAAALMRAASASASPVGRRQPLVVIRFRDDDVQYRDALQQAVSATLERRPESGFDVVAVAPTAGTPTELALDVNSAKRNAERVRRSLLEMGVPASRLTLSNASSADAEVGEVHVYIR